MWDVRLYPAAAKGRATSVLHAGCARGAEKDTLVEVDVSDKPLKEERSETTLGLAAVHTVAMTSPHSVSSLTKLTYHQTNMFWRLSWFCRDQITSVTSHESNSPGLRIYLYSRFPWPRNHSCSPQRAQPTPRAKNSDEA